MLASQQIILFGTSAAFVSGLLPAPDDPTLTLTTGATDNTPGFDVTNVLSGDVVRIEYDTHLDFSAASSVTGTAGSGTISIVTGALADGLWYFRARIERSGYAASGWSNTVSETIDATAPTITSANSTSVAENATLSWSIVTDENATVVIGGADAARFELASNPSSTTRTLRWASNGTKDFEAPNDANTDNVYVCTLTPTDAVGNVGNAQTFSATVTDVGEGTWALVAHASAGATGADTGATTSGVDTTGATLIVVGVSHSDAATGLVSDSKGNTFTALTGTNGPGTQTSKLFYCASPVVGSGHTFTISGTTTYGAIAVDAFSGVVVSPFDLEAGGSGTSSTPSAGAGITPSENNCLVVATVATAAQSVSSINGGFTITDTVAPVSSQHYGLGLAYLVQTTAAAADPDWTITASEGYAARIASFKHS